MATPNTQRGDLIDAIETARIADDRSVAWLARRGNIPTSTLRRKLAGEADFSVWEVAALARALGVRVSDLLPEGWENAEQDDESATEDAA
ncbi:ribosome-binding protein aMBF1 (putative translation factor) [Microbacterium marinum]|uniref:Ribosome-binding protein aMBF1 (Putative translation factor) n=1 Tax=Microbacterium marinum TaxID=421115 RepID=A0A7W7BQG8_9MICO|nr:helix-turn-helix transcriptional regulator [Microbacterium marinum]MBB4666943.1 ribosome-binding protein aMBF1 (putative translation factor) [Microbacterium marinum]